MCTTSIECKTVMTATLMVMSDMDPHMISGTRDLVGLGFVKVGFIRLWVGQVRLRDAIEIVTLRR
jgi:hypothetical protein